ncbi:unnamed protein product [Orchesella dallaii]|uniref:Uncharacterized protein n=1 Tax=Orchesella dallaii TaxID=48710 RepID=A0ABP1PWV3_9HEXA
MEINRIILNLTIIFLVIVLVLDFCSYFVQSSPVSLANRGDVLRIPNVVSGNDNDENGLDFEFLEIQQGTRRRRFAFPVDVQDTLCPPGEKLDSSTLTCVPDIGKDVY